MGFLNFFKTKDIDAGVQDFLTTKGAVLLDVRTVEEYREGHIDKSENLPLQSIHMVNYNKDTPLFVYCHSGARSAQATAMLKELGYNNVNDIGGIMSYSGKVVR